MDATARRMSAAPPPDPEPRSVSRLEQDRDLYLRLLNLGLKDEVEPFLAEALELITHVVGAHQGYLEISAGDGHVRWSTAHGFSDDEVDAVRRELSRGIIAAALADGTTVVTGSAVGDQRFAARSSVREARIEAVICAPLGRSPSFGVVYLQRRHEPGAFTDEGRCTVELFARHVAPYAERLLARVATSASDPTRPYRERLRLGPFVGRSTALAGVLREVALIAPLDVDVLLTGESGTGKSQVARIIHENSRRAAHPFVELNCAAIPESLIENELFGAVPGGHSTAVRRIEGKVAAAQGGTLLLDEVGELTPAAQAKLLQLLQSRTYYPLGGTKPVRADLRIIAAINADLQSAVAAGPFREDVYYLLSVVPLRMPTLSERREDVADLARHFCAAACERHRLPCATLTEQLVEALVAAEWPGNVRQLAHAVEAAVIRAVGSGCLHVERSHFFGPSSTVANEASNGAPDAWEGFAGLTFQEATRRFQARLVRETLEATGWNVVEASRRLEIARSHLYGLIRAFGLTRTRR